MPDVTFRAVGRDLAGLIHVSSLHVDRQRPQVVVAGTWRQAYRSEDGGRTWRGVFDGMVLDSEVFSLHAAVDRPGELWASTCGWVYRGDGLGDKWTRFQTGLSERRTPSFAVLPGERLLAGTVAGAFLSTDRGASFRRTTPESLAVLAIAYHPARPERILIGTEGAGIWSSTDAGESFRARPVAMRNLRVPALDQDGAHLFAAVAHAGPRRGSIARRTVAARSNRCPRSCPRSWPWRSPANGSSSPPSAASSSASARRQRAPGAPKTAPRCVSGASRSSGIAASSSWRRRRGGSWRGPARRCSRSRPRPPARAFVCWPSAFDGAGRPAVPGLRSAALAAGDLWVLRDDGLTRMVDGKPQAASLPYPPAAGSELFSVAGELHYSGREGLYRRDTASGAWMPVRSGPLRTIATGSVLFPYLVEAHGALSLLSLRAPSPAGEGAWLPIELPFPARETLSALVAGDRLLLGSSGFGVWQAVLPTTAAGEPQRSTVSEARIRR